jgi:hypothetical protein
VKSGFLMIVPTYAKVSIISKKLTFNCLLMSMVLLMSVDSCERTVETVEFADVLPCKKSSIRLLL